MLDIKLSYDEGGGRVNRAYHLPENPKLVASILGAIKRHGPKEEPAQEEKPDEEGGEPGTDAYPWEEGPEPEPEDKEPEAEEDKADGEPEDKEPEDEAGKEAKKPKLYQGFILVRCEACGRITGTCLKKPGNVYHCRCGNNVKLEGLISAAFHCPCCDQTWTYRTNVTDDPLVYNCLNCGAEMQSWWNEKKNRYQFER